MEVVWNPKLSFLKKGFCETPIFKSPLTVEWSFQVPKKRIQVCSFIQCTMRAKGVEVQGFGYSFLPKKAYTVALAEAWERMVFQLYREQHHSPLQVRFSSTGYAAGSNAIHARRSAIEEYKERYLLYLAGRNISKVRNYKFQDTLSSLLIYFIEKEFGFLESYVYEEEWGSLLALCVKGDEGMIYDSIFFNKYTERKSVRKILLSLLSSVFKEIKAPSLQRNLHLQDCTNIETQLVYDGGLLPPVAVAFDPVSTRTYLNELSQDELFAFFYSQIHKPT